MRCNLQQHYMLLSLAVAATVDAVLHGDVQPQWLILPEYCNSCNGLFKAYKATTPPVVEASPKHLTSISYLSC